MAHLYDVCNICALNSDVCINSVSGLEPFLAHLYDVCNIYALNLVGCINSVFGVWSHLWHIFMMYAIFCPQFSWVHK